MKTKLYIWNDLYERADGTGFGSPELKAKDNARSELTEIIKKIKGYNIDDRECPEDEIDMFLWNANKEFLFNESGHLEKVIRKEIKI